MNSSQFREMYIEFIKDFKTENMKEEEITTLQTLADYESITINISLPKLVNAVLLNPFFPPALIKGVLEEAIITIFVRKKELFLAGIKLAQENEMIKAKNS